MNNVLLRPNTVAMDRRDAATPSATGARTPVTVSLNTAVPALIDMEIEGAESFEIDGINYTQDSVLFVDGLQPYQFPGVSPGGTIVLAGVTYTVAGNGQAAFTDLLRGDRVTDENAQTYLVLAVSLYYGFVPSLQAKLGSGQVWA